MNNTLHLLSETEGARGKTKQYVRINEGIP